MSHDSANSATEEDMLCLQASRPNGASLEDDRVSFDSMDAVVEAALSDIRRQHSAFLKIIKYVLFAASFLTLLGGLCLIAAGALAKMDDRDLGFLRLLPVDVALLLLLLGALATVISMLGCIVSVREHVLGLKVFCGCVGVLFLCEFCCCLTGFLYMHRIEEDVAQRFLGYIRRYDAKWEKRVVDVLQTDLQCCGLSGPDDWEHNRYYECSSPSKYRCGVPYSCCRATAMTTVVNSFCGMSTRVATPEGESTASAAIWTNGCSENMKQLISHHLLIVTFVAFAVSFIELVSIVLAFLLIQRLLIVIAQMDALGEACQLHEQSRKENLVVTQDVTSNTNGVEKKKRRRSSKDEVVTAPRSTNVDFVAI